MDNWIQLVIQAGALGLCVMLIWDNKVDRARMAKHLTIKDEQFRQLSERAIVAIERMTSVLADRPCVRDSDVRKVSEDTLR